jgi:hypothetical protein
MTLQGRYGGDVRTSHGSCKGVTTRALHGHGKGVLTLAM